MKGPLVKITKKRKKMAGILSCSGHSLVEYKMTQESLANLNQSLRVHARPENRKAWVQIINTFIPFLTIFALMVFLASKDYNYAFILTLSVVQSILLLRIFVIFHDCAHGSFHSSKLFCEILGHIAGVLVFTPFASWKREHFIHHSSVGNLDKRGIGDIWTMTVQEYNHSGYLKQLIYRLYRNPIFIFLLGPCLLFLIKNRFSNKKIKNQYKMSIYFTNIMLLLIIALFHLTVGIQVFILVEFPILILTMMSGVWLFYIQHQFEETYWSRQIDWNQQTAAFKGSSFIDFPGILHWCTANICYHNIHHLKSKIPNYHLAAAHSEVSNSAKLSRVSAWEAASSVNLKLWDETEQKLIRFSELKV